MILELKAEMQKMKSNMQHVEALQVNEQVQAILMRCQRHEDIVKQQLESMNVLRKEESRLKTQECDLAERLSKSSEELTNLNSEGRAYVTHVAEEINEAKLETAAERKVTLDQRTA